MIKPQPFLLAGMAVVLLAGIGCDVQPASTLKPQAEPEPVPHEPEPAPAPTTPSQPGEPSAFADLVEGLTVDDVNRIVGKEGEAGFPAGGMATHSGKPEVTYTWHVDGWKLWGQFHNGRLAKWGHNPIEADISATQQAQTHTLPPPVPRAAPQQRSDPVVYVAIPGATFPYLLSPGEKYHTESCQYIQNATNPIKSGHRSGAQAIGYEACKVCSPG